MLFSSRVLAFTLLFLLSLVLAVSACAHTTSSAPIAGRTQERLPTAMAGATRSASRTTPQVSPRATFDAGGPTPTGQPSLTIFSSTPRPTASSTPTYTPDPYAGMAIAELAARSYGGGQLEILDTLEETETFTRYLIAYPSDGLKLYGFLSVPREGTKFPVAIVAHGYIDPEEYEVEAYTTRYANALTEAGFLVIHPNFRNYPPSDAGTNPFRIGYAVDLLNLIAIVREQSQDPTGYLRRADGQRIYLMGHSMGGGALLRTITVWPDAVRAAVLYGAMSGDEARNFGRIQIWSGGAQGSFELAAPPETLEAVSPIHHLDRITAPVSIHHSLADTVVPPEWSEELCSALQTLRKEVECFTYENTPHTFRGYADRLFTERMIRFFQQH